MFYDDIEYIEKKKHKFNIVNLVGIYVMIPAMP